LLHLKTVGYFLFYLNTHQKALRTKILTVCHGMFDSTLQLILPPKTYLPITVASVLGLGSWNTTVQLFVEHFNAEITGFFSLFVQRGQEVIAVSEAFAKVEADIEFGTVYSAD
jgi:hypothetical protein